VRNFQRIVVIAATGVAAALLVGAASAGSTSQAKIVLFTAKYAGTATVQVNDNVADISAAGVGTGTLIKKSKIVGKGTGDSSQQPCVPFTGRGSMANATGTKIIFQVLPGSSGCGDEQGQVFSVVGRAKVLGGTKAFRKAKGTLKITGVYDRGAGTFSVKFTGKVTVLR
jgi:hypothetical protein